MGMFKWISAMVLALAIPAAAQSNVSLTGAGATFPQPLYEKWISHYSTANPHVKISYNAIGSGGGIKQITAREVDFGASDAPLSAKERDAARKNGQDLLQIPTTLGAVVAIYNVAGLDATTPLKFSGPVLADLFSGKIRKWNDPRIAEFNRDIADKLPDAEVRIVHRDDPSGTTYVFTEYLSKISGDWKPAKTSENWPKGSQAGKGNARVADAVKAGKNTLGYVELNYAMANKIPFAHVQNKAGRFVEPNLAGVSAAAKLPQLPEDLGQLSLTDSAAEDAYPIAAATYLLIPRQMSDPAKAAALKAFVVWCLTDGQKMAEGLYYAPLPAELADKARAAVEQVSAGER